MSLERLLVILILVVVLFGLLFYFLPAADAVELGGKHAAHLLAGKHLAYLAA